MTTPKQIEANRRNALRSTGPRTQAGKAIVSQNAARHGLYSASPVIPGVESPLAWEQHLASIVASFAPVGPVETALAERIALILWRIKRITRYERDVTSGSRERASSDLSQLADLRRERILPERAQLDHVIRYETHLTRQLSQTIAQLEALQHARRRAAIFDSSPPTAAPSDEERFPAEQTHSHAQPLRVVPAAQPDGDRLCAHSDHENASPDHG